MSEATRYRTGVLSAIERGELSVAQGVKALRTPAKRRRRAWLPLWFRVVVVSHGRGVRLAIPLFIVGPLCLALFVALLPLAVLAVALVSIRRRGVLGHFIQGIGLLNALTATLLLHGRGAGVHVKDQDSEIGFWLS
ncbi:MAG: hypothetical protein EXS64_01805 [Candidatus Latescibacteria bacterium]|nr:hypothetical protein [Candidatus Latescibacterota bacterium]